ncbi:MAG: putative family phosphotransferase fused to gluconate kinase family enzyme [Verrucomicrobiota bacterium]
MTGNRPRTSVASVRTMNSARHLQSSSLADAALSAQERMLPFLLNPASYPHHPKSVRLIQTHSAFVFVAAPWVYKVKKAVNFGFLDFSTLKRRHHFCEREMELNRRLTSGVYLEVVPVVQVPGGYRLGGKGRVVDYAIRMRQLSARFFLDRLLERGAVDNAALDRVTARLGIFYRAQPPDPHLAEAGRIPRLRIATEENFRQSRPFIGQTLSSAAFEAIRTYTDTSYRRLARLFAARVREGRIRDCHGDLHLEHIHLTPRTLNIYDCIEFNERFRQVDVANDVAFLTMDLEFHGRRDLARHVAVQMARELNDPGLLHLLGFYQTYRAVVRGKVESLRSQAHAASEADRKAAIEVARRYFRLALNDAVAGTHPLVLAVMGTPGSGKSTLAQSLAAELGWRRIASDEVRKERAGIAPDHRGTAAERRALYATARTDDTYRVLRESAATLSATDQGLVLDATYSRRQHRDALRRDCASAGIPLCFLEARAPRRVLQQRLRARDGRSGEVSDARIEDLSVVLGNWDPPDELPAADHLRISTHHSPEATVSRALTALARRQATVAAAGARGREGV